MPWDLLWATCCMLPHGVSLLMRNTRDQCCREGRYAHRIHAGHKQYTQRVPVLKLLLLMHVTQLFGVSNLTLWPCRADDSGCMRGSVSAQDSSSAQVQATPSFRHSIPGVCFVSNGTIAHTWVPIGATI